MSDLVSRQYLLDEYDRLHVGPPGRARKIIEDAPSAQVDKSYELWKESYEVLKEEYDNLTQCDDCISRQAAIKAIAAISNLDIRYVRAIEGLPSAQPEIIRCKNCKWYQTKYCVMDINMEGLTIFKAKENDYCSKAERRTDG